MSFPLTVGDRVLADPPSMAAAVRSDCGLVSGTVVSGKRPVDWVMDLVGEGRFERRLAIGLAAALIQNPEAATIAEGARLALALDEHLLGPLVRKALEGHETGLLLSADPGSRGASVEDTLLVTACALVDAADPVVRADLLERLRHAGLRDLELEILLRFGDVDDLRSWLPAILLEGVSDHHLVLITAALARNDARTDVIREVVGTG